MLLFQSCFTTAPFSPQIFGTLLSECEHHLPFWHLKMWPLNWASLRHSPQALLMKTGNDSWSWKQILSGFTIVVCWHPNGGGSSPYLSYPIYSGSHYIHIYWWPSHSSPTDLVKLNHIAKCQNNRDCQALSIAAAKALPLHFTWLEPSHP